MPAPAVPTAPAPDGPVVAGAVVTKRWGRTIALDGASFEIGRGITGLVGANGAGKTTLLGLVLGLHPPDAGTLQVLGRDPWTEGADVRALVGYAPEHDALPEDVSAHEIVRHLAEVHGLPRAAATERASDVLAEVGLGEERFRPVGTFSTGQRQRVKLAQAIAHDPALVLLDEPTNGLDPVQREEVLRLVRHVGHDLGIDVVVSSHLLEEIERVSDAVVLLEEGRVVANGPLRGLGAAGDEVVVDLDGDDGQVAAFADALEAAGMSVAADGSRLLVVAADDAVFDLIRDAAATTGAGIRSLRRRTLHLEDVFLGRGAT